MVQCICSMGLTLAISFLQIYSSSNCLFRAECECIAEGNSGEKAMEIRKFWSFKRYSDCLYETALQICADNAQIVSLLQMTFPEMMHTGLLNELIYLFFGKAPSHTTKGPSPHPQNPLPRNLCDSTRHTELKIKAICLFCWITVWQKWLSAWSSPFPYIITAAVRALPT